MKTKVWEYVQKHDLLSGQDRIVVGVSGGADSVCLFLLMLEFQKEIPLEFCVVHVEHGIRGKESLHDEMFVRTLCEKHGIEYILKQYEVPSLAKEWGMSLEEAGRNVRYQAFRQVKKEWGGTKIATAHHRNDQAETVLMNLFRGTGISGLRGMEPKTEDLIRPLLCVTRQEIEDWLKLKDCSYCVDSTNSSEVYTRNRIRQRILPEAVLVNAKAVEHIASLAEVAGTCEAYLQKISGTVFERIVQKREDELFLGEELLMEEDLIQGYVLRRALLECGQNGSGLKNIGQVHVDSVKRLFESENGKRILLPGGWHVRKTYGGICLKYENEQKDPQNDAGTVCSYIPAIPGEVRTKDGRIFRFRVFDYKKGQEIPEKAYTKWFDYDKIKGSLEIRTRGTGDYLTVTIGGGKKKLKDYFIDKKIDRVKRDGILLLAEGKHVLWAVGYRISEYYRITDATIRVLEVTTEQDDQDDFEGGYRNE